MMGGVVGVFRELWQHRDLALVLGWRELVVRYKRSVLGIAWALAEPLVLAIVYVAVFGYVLGAQNELPNYALLAFLGVLAWTFLSSTLEQGTTTLLEHSALLKKSYFPWEILLLGVTASRLSTLILGLLLALPLALLVGDTAQISWPHLWLVPVGVVGLTGLTLGAVLILSPLHVILSDTHFLLRFVLRIGFFLCPIVYPLSMVPDQVRGLYELNPLVGVLWAFQAFSSVSLPPPSGVGLAVSAVCCGALPVLGWWLFRRLRWYVADLL